MGFICGPRIYKFDGWLFEVHAHSGPWPLKKDFGLRERAGRKFWAMWDKWCKLRKDEQDKCRIGGGCQRF